MFILTTNDGHAYKNTDAMPLIYETFDNLRQQAEGGPYPLDDWYALELSKREADFITTQAFLAIYGRRAGLSF